MTKQQIEEELKTLLNMFDEGRITIDTSPALIERVNELCAALDSYSHES